VFLDRPEEPAQKSSQKLTAIIHNNLNILFLKLSI